jgi:hypothetical protein
VIGFFTEQLVVYNIQGESNLNYQLEGPIDSFDVRELK